MRLDTAEKRAAYRLVMIPKDSTLDPRSNEKGAVYVYQFPNGKLAAMAFVGTAAKPCWHYSYRTPEAREQKIAEFFAGIDAHQEFKAKQKAATSDYVHDVKVGDIFRCSWGYDQTNIDYYQCVALIGDHMMEVREIGQQRQETQWAQGECAPVPDMWATEVDYSPEGETYKTDHGHYPRKEKRSKRVKIQKSGSEPCFRVASYASAYRIKPLAEVANTKIYETSHWTAYA